MQMYFLPLVAVLGATSLFVEAANFLEFRALIDIVEWAKQEERPGKCQYLVLKMNEVSLGPRFPEPGHEDFRPQVEYYLNVGKESSLYAQNLEYIRIFVECLQTFGSPTLPFAFYAKMILSEPTKRLDESDLIISRALSSLATAAEPEKFIPKQVLIETYYSQSWHSRRAQCGLFAMDVNEIVQEFDDVELNNQNKVDILSKSKESAIHSRNLELILLIVNCLRVFGQKTLTPEFYRHLNLDMNEILPESLSDIYGGILDYDDDDPADIDFPSMSELMTGVSLYNDKQFGCLAIATEIFKLVHPDDSFLVEDPDIYVRLIRLMKYGRAASRNARYWHQERIFRDCVIELEEMYDSVTTVYYGDSDFDSQSESEEDE